jgi:hypothetical protein
MDGTLRDYLKVDTSTAKSIISEIIKEIKQVDGHMISLWHNESLSEWKNWLGWTKVYHEILHAAS